MNGNETTYLLLSSTFASAALTGDLTLALIFVGDFQVKFSLTGIGYIAVFMTASSQFFVLQDVIQYIVR